ncbi:hypothetical protein GGU11DRAFT_760679 [Lentinula aff. detonsa]|nr:hypothetical protein GGU11DRAFT_760679 [Lentinula aff. detonsa]
MSGGRETKGSFASSSSQTSTSVENRDKRTMFPRPTRQSAHVKQQNRAKERLEFHLQVEKTRTHRHPHPLLLFQTWPACPKQQCLLARVVQKRMSDMVQGINDDAEDFRANAEYRMQEGFNELNALIAEHIPSLELDAQGNLVPKATDRIDNPASMMDPIDVESPTDNTKNREYIYVPPAKRVPKSEDTQSRPMSTLQYRSRQSSPLWICSIVFWTAESIDTSCSDDGLAVGGLDGQEVLAIAYTKL